MSSQLPPMPNLIHDEWEKYSLEDLREEMANTRRFVASLFLQVKEWTSRMNDLEQTSEQIVALKADRDAAYITLSNKTNELDENIELIMQTLGIKGEKGEV